MAIIPFTVTAEFSAIQHEREEGTFRGSIAGYRIWSNRTAGRLVWHLPGGAAAALRTLRRGEWSIDFVQGTDDCGCDATEDFEEVVGIGSSDFATDGSPIAGSFAGSGQTEVIRLSSDDDPDEVGIAIAGEDEESYDDVSEAIARIEELLGEG